MIGLYCFVSAIVSFDINSQRNRFGSFLANKIYCFDTPLKAGLSSSPRLTYEANNSLAACLTSACSASTFSYAEKIGLCVVPSRLPSFRVVNAAAPSSLTRSRAFCNISSFENLNFGGIALHSFFVIRLLYIGCLIIPFISICRQYIRQSSSSRIVQHYSTSCALALDYIQLSRINFVFLGKNKKPLISRVLN